MIPNLRIAIEQVVNKYYAEAKGRYKSYSPQARPPNMIYPYLQTLKDYVCNRKSIAPPDAGTEEQVNELINAMKVVMNSCNLSAHDITECNNLLRSFHALNEQDKKNITNYPQAKELLLIRMRNILNAQVLDRYS